MSSIDPAQFASRATEIPGLNEQELDPATILLAMSAAQMNIVQQSLLSRVPNVDAQFDQLGRIGEATTSLKRLRDSVVGGELEEAENLLHQLEKFRAGRNPAEENSLVVNESDQQNLADVLEWAQQRGFPAGELTKQVPVPKPPKAETEAEKTEGGTAATEEEAPVEMQTVVDEEAFLKLQDRLKNYIAALKTGEVDNPAIRHRLQDHSEYGEVVGELQRLGIDYSLESLEHLDRAVSDLNSQFDALMKIAQRDAGQLALLAGEMEKAAQGVEEMASQQSRLENRSSDRHLETQQEDLQNLELDEQRRAQLQQLLDTLNQAKSVLDRLSLPDDFARNLLQDLPVSAQKEIDAKVYSWQQDLNSQLESLGASPLPESRPLRSAKAYV